jgi:regulatory protein
VRRRPKPEAAAAAAEADERTVRTAGYALLAGRDFSVAEITGRLLRRGYGAQVVEEAVANLVREGFLREERYAGNFVTRQAGRGRGPMRIRVGLRDKGVARESIEQALGATETDWTQAAREARRRKFGASLPGDARERAKQARFLQYRGFSSEQIRAALGPGEDGPEYDPDQ